MRSLIILFAAMASAASFSSVTTLVGTGMAGYSDTQVNNPYGMTFEKLGNRCPDCANELESEEAVVCLHCGSAIYPPSIGQKGGCNPAPLPSHQAGGELVIA